jgi:hypothetical protein
MPINVSFFRFIVELSIIYASAFKKNRSKIGRILSRFVLFDIQDFINSIFQTCKKVRNKYIPYPLFKRRGIISVDFCFL